MKRCMAKAQSACRIALTSLVFGALFHAAAPAEPPRFDSQPSGIYQTPEEAFTEAMRNSIGAPALAELGDKATVRLAGDLIIVPRDEAVRLMTIWGMTVPPDLVGLLMGPNGMSSPGIIRYVPAGFIDLPEAAQWTPEDYLSSLQDTIESRNAERLEKHLPELGVRRWIRPPGIDAANKRILWAALILPTTAPIDSDGAITFNAVSFGRHGYIKLSIVSSVQDAASTGTMFDTFLNGLTFRPGETYGDVQPADARSPAGLAGALGIDSLHKAGSSVLASLPGLLLPIAGGLVALIGALSLVVHVRRTLREDANRW
jgi:uncharacterized membrane-anchored protein